MPLESDLKGRETLTSTWKYFGGRARMSDEPIRPFCVFYKEKWAGDKEVNRVDSTAQLQPEANNATSLADLPPEAEGTASVPSLRQGGLPC